MTISDYNRITLLRNHVLVDIEEDIPKEYEKYLNRCARALTMLEYDRDWTKECALERAANAYISGRLSKLNPSDAYLYAEKCLKAKKETLEKIRKANETGSS